MKVSSKAIGSIAGGAVTGGLGIAIPVVMDKSPSEVATKFAEWAPVLAYTLPFLYVVAALLVLVGVALISHSRGRKLGSAEQAARPPIAFEPIAEPANSLVSDKGVTLNQLALSVREIVAALSEKGACRADTVRNNLVRLETEHPAWHLDGPFNLRARFCKASRDALEARTEGSNSALWVTGDYPGNVREHHVQTVKNLGDMLKGELSKLPRTVALR